MNCILLAVAVTPLATLGLSTLKTGADGRPAFVPCDVVVGTSSERVSAVAADASDVATRALRWLSSAESFPDTPCTMPMTLPTSPDAVALFALVVIGVFPLFVLVTIALHARFFFFCFARAAIGERRNASDAVNSP